MKLRMFLLLLLIFFSACKSAVTIPANKVEAIETCQGVEELAVGDYYAVTFTGPLSGKPHESAANCFAKQVGFKLKANYPSQLVDIKIDLATYMKGGVKIFVLKYSTRIVSATEEQADYYFEHAGTMLPGPTLEKAQQAVEDEIQKSDKALVLRKRFEAIYSNSNMPLSFVVKSYSGSNTEQEFWFVKEYFATAKKNKPSANVNAARTP